SLHVKYKNGDKQLKDSIVNISHDLRTPLTVINGYTQKLREKTTDKESLKQLDTVQSRVDELIVLTEELFRYTVTADAELDPNIERTLINAALEESVLGFYSAFTERGITPKIDICDKKIYRNTDASSLSRIFNNIISNAIKYADRDFSAELDESGIITFSNAARDLNYIDVERLLDRYYTVKSNSESTGLGLSIARLLAEKLGFELTARYEDGRLKIMLKL
ncbi:MAG: HAMP domain-containing histidine kinase, partial [Clostridiales bacterium]|nr:HAMP domain-containing histidine kinase [Clostridiales bacterium]